MNQRGEKEKKGQLKLSFGMIFSIILIIIFLAFAIYAITKFLGLQDTLKIEGFFDDLQNDIDKVWKGSQASIQIEYLLPKKIDAVCFTDNEYENLFFQSESIIRGKKIEHIDILEITKNGKEDPFCIDNKNGKVKMIIKKDFGESLVTITKQE
jgi:hypothetical protein